LAHEGTGPFLLNYSNLVNNARGINGLVLYMEGLSNLGSLSSSDFIFQMSPQGAFDEGANPPSGWTTPPAPTSDVVTPGTPNQLIITWPDIAIENMR